MFEALHHLDRGKLFGLIFVLVLHGAGLYGLWSYRIIPTPDEALVLMVNLISPQAPEQPKPEPPKPPKPRPIVPPPEHLHLAVEAPPADRKSTRLNSSHQKISYAVFCLKKKNKRTGKSQALETGDHDARTVDRRNVP